MKNQDHEDIRDLIPAYALHTLDSQEARRVRQHLAGCAVCREDLYAYLAVADTLPLAAPEADPPTDLKARILRSAQPGDHLPGNDPGKVSRGQPVWRRVQLALPAPLWQAAVLLAILILGLTSSLLWIRLAQVERQVQAPRQFFLTGTAAAPQAQGVILVGSDPESATLIVEDLPDLGEEQQYQLWLVRDGQRVSGGVFSTGPDGYQSLRIWAPLPLWDYSAFGITIEPAGGSPGPTGERVLGSNL